MAATVTIREMTGDVGSPTSAVSTSARFCTADNNNPGTSFPLVKPEGATINRSFWKTFFLSADTSPAGTINNVKWYTTGNPAWTGVNVYVGTSGSYVQATGSQGVTGDDCAVASAAASGYTSGAPLDVTGTISNPNTGKISDFVLLQAEVTSAAGAGTVPAITVWWRYDET